MPPIRRALVLSAAVLPALVALPLGGAFGCSSPHPPRDSAAPAASAPASEPDLPGAFDTLKLVRFSRQVGPVYFAHDLHADLLDRRGAPIACVRCHHRLKSDPALPPQGCSSCHLGEDQAREPGLPPNT
jgi:hypothetical protein